MPEYKNNHYVPQLYLRNWSLVDDTKKIYSFHIKNQKTNTEFIKKTAQKDNLYTSKLRIKDHPGVKGNEKHLISTFESMYNNSSKVLKKGIVPTGRDLGSLKAFIIVQSFRSNKLAKFFSANVNFDEESQHKKLNYTYADWLTEAILIQYVKWSERATIDLYRAPIGHRFLTSDNPSSYWVRVKNQTFKLIDYHSFFSEFDNITNNPDFCILCPILPNWLGIVYPNIRLIKTKFQTENADIVDLNIIQQKILNRMIEDQADNLIYAKKLKDFI